MKKNLLAIFILCNLISYGFAQNSGQKLEAAFDKLRNDGIQNLKTTAEREAAIDLCLKMAQRSASDPAQKDIVSQAYLLSGQIRRMIGLTQSDDAIADLKMGLKKDPNNPNLNRELGFVYMDVDMWKEAKFYLEKTVNMNTKDLDAYRGLIKLGVLTNDDTLQVRCLTKYLSIDSTDAGMWVKLGKLQQSLGRIERAEESYEHAQRIDPLRADALQALAEIRTQQGKLAEAQASLSAIPDNEPMSPSARARYVELKLKLEKQQNVDRHLKAGQKLLQSKKIQDWVLSLTEFRKVLEYEPENYSARQNFSLARKKLCDFYYQLAYERELKEAWQNALELYTSSLVYAESDSDSERAFEKQKLAAQKRGKIIEARNAKAAADSALHDQDFREALSQYVAAELLDPSLRELIQSNIAIAKAGENFQLAIKAFKAREFDAAKAFFGLYFEQADSTDLYYSEARGIYGRVDTLSQIIFLKPRYEQAIASRKWQAARIYLIDLVKLAPDSVAYRNDLELAKQEVWNERAWFVFQIAIWILGPVPLLMIILLNKKVQKAIQKGWRKLPELFQPWRLRANSIWIIFLATGFLVYYLIDRKFIPDPRTIPGIVTLLGILIFLTIVSMAIVRKPTLVDLRGQTSQFSFCLSTTTLSSYLGC